ncbi:Tyrosyl-tRNA synthetase, mitochondrial, partial [hydrothermal vent metagenome]
MENFFKSNQIKSNQIKSNQIKSNRILVSALMGLLISPLALSADYHKDDYEKLLKEANKNGVASVLIALEKAPLVEIQSSLITVASRTDSQAELLINELGKETSRTGYWNNSIGQIGLYVTAKGLQKLIDTDLAISFMPDSTRTSRIRAEGEDGSLKEIESLLDKQGFANVEVFLNIDGIEYDISTTGGEDSYKPISSSKLTGVATAANIATSLITSSSNTQGIELISSTATSMRLKNKPSFTAKIDREAYLDLRENENVRAIRPIGFIDKREAYWSAEAMELSAKNPEKNMDIIISLRGGELFSSRTGYMSTSAVTSQENAHARAINSVFTNAGLPPSFNSRYDKTGAYSVALKYSELKKLYAQKDNRILSLELNKPVAKVMLNRSTELINMPAAWNAGYTAAGQNIIVMDTGIRKSHHFFSKNGQSKVIYEACFGTTSWTGYTTGCINPDSNGDSPLGLVGSGEPSVNCSKGCDHGSHVAGIAAGRAGTGSLLPYPLPSGVAPKANLVSVNVSSHKPESDVGIFRIDILAALTAVKSAMTPNTNNNPYTVNMSIGGTLRQQDCFIGTGTGTNTSISRIIKELTSIGVPIVVSAGNDGVSLGIGSRNGMSWPACVQETIKVSSVTNDGVTLVTS